MADLSKRLDMTLAAVSCAVKRGEKIAKKEGYHLEGSVILVFKDVPLLH